jgi:hypothetical protein
MRDVGYVKVSVDLYRRLRVAADARGWSIRRIVQRAIRDVAPVATPPSSCVFCHNRLVQKPVGRPRKFCSRRCTRAEQRWQARQKRREAGC